MICRHCGARIERGTMSVHLGTDGNSPDGQTVYFAGGPSSCAHEPEEPSDPQGWPGELVRVTPQQQQRPTTRKRAKV